MCIFPVLVLLILPNIISASPVSIPPKDFYSALVGSCPTIDLANNQSFAQQDVFKNCKNWTEIEHTKNITEHNENNVRCLLYFDSFISFCKEITAAGIEKIDQHFIIPDLKIYNVENICENWTLAATEKLKHNTSKSIIIERKCKKLCTTYDDTVPLECSLAHYFANFNVTTLPDQKILKVAPGETTNDVKSLPPKDQPLVAALAVATVKENKSPADAPQTADAHNEGPSVLHAGTSDNVEEQGQHETEIEARALLHASTGDNLNDAQGQKPTGGEIANPQEVAEKAQTPLPSKVVEGVDETPKEESAVRHVLVGNNAPDVKIPRLTEEADHSKLEAVKVEAGSADPQNSPEDAKQNEKSQLETQPELPQDESAVDEAAGVVDDGVVKTNPEKGAEENADDGEYDNDEHDDDNKAEHGEDPDEIDNAEKDKPLANEVDKKQEQMEKQKVEQKAKQETKQNDEKNNVVVDSPISQSNSDSMEGASNFFSYFMVVCVLFVLGYVGYHNRQKVMALVLEGKRGKRQYRGRRPNSANYHKLDSNLEEAISSTCTKNSSHVIY